MSGNNLLRRLAVLAGRDPLVVRIGVDVGGLTGMRAGVGFCVFWASVA